MKKQLKWIGALKIWIAIYPSLTVVNYVFGNQLLTLPVYLRTLVVTLILVPWMVFMALPLMNRLIDRLRSLDTNSLK
ncbi:MAG TPA: hypothetical protein VHK91_17385 [Flavisolibacter sp.]|jgi:hypothetical protein|nr:hypothetical protein [Flavisolibacter sp.]